MQPQVGESKVRFIENFLRTQTKVKQGKPLQILEWGSGGSTVYFSKWLHKEQIPFKWVSLEYDKEWHELVSKEIEDDKSTDVVYFEVNGNPRSREVLMDDYVSYPGTLGLQFDFIFIDGRKRRRCVHEAKKLLASQGIVLVHDAWRKRYQCAYKIFPTSRFIDRSLWMGTFETPSVFRRLQNGVVNTFYILRGRIRELKKAIKVRLRHVLD